MRALLVVGLLAIVSLSGCSGGSGLAAYVLNGGEVPMECDYTPVEQLREEAESEGVTITSNPGAVNNDAFGEQGIVANYIALFTCPDIEGEIYSTAVQFADASDAQAAASGMNQWICDEDGSEGAILIQGPIMAQIFVDGETLVEMVAEFAQTIEARTGATNICDLPQGDPEA